MAKARTCLHCVCFLLILGCRPASRDDDVAAALADYRPYRARFTASLGFAPCVALAPEAFRNREELPGVTSLSGWFCSPRPLPRSPAFAALGRASEIFVRANRESATEAELLKAANIQLLLQGDLQDTERAAKWLRRGLQIAADRQPFLADLGAVHLVLAELSGKTEELLRSVEYSELALQERPEALGPRFNLALALTELGLSDSAKIEWQRFLARSPASPWALEARGRLSSMPSAAGDSFKKEIVTRLAAALDGGDYETLLAAGRENRQLTREWIETDLIPAWAEARVHGDKKKAALSLDGAVVLARYLAETTGDLLLLETVTAISGGAEVQRDQLARGHRELSQGLSLIRENPETARELLYEAERSFKSGKSPFAFWARLHQARTLHIDQQFQKADRVLTLLARDTDAFRYPVLAGRIHWIHGLVASNLGRIEESTVHYRSAATIFLRLGEEQNLAATQGLLAAGLHKVGRYEAAWSLTRCALACRGRISNFGILQAILQDAANNADRQGLLRGGLHLADEFVSVAEREGAAMNRINAYNRRAALREALGQSSAAQSDRADAERLFRSLPSKAQNKRAAADGAVETARKSGKVLPAPLLEDLSKAISHYRETGNLQKLPEAYGLRARGYRALGKIDLAGADLNEEARLLELSHIATSPGPSRQGRLVVLQEFFDQMIDFQAAVRNDSDKAFQFTERQRHWALWEWARTAVPSPGRSPAWGDRLDTASWPDLKRQRQGDTAILAYHVLPQQILIWVDGPHGSALVKVAGDREQLLGKVGELLAAAKTKDRKVSRASAASLYDLLIGPVAAMTGEASLWVVVPDRVLQNLPFGLLLDASANRFLHENRALVFAPSATAFLRLGMAATRPAGESSRFLLAAWATRGSKARLSNLSLAEAEATAVAHQWEAGRALSFRDTAEVKRQLLEADVFHFAGHAVADSESLRLVFHDDGEHSLKLTASDIAGDRFPRLRLVSLSGCRTADVGLAGQVDSLSAGFVRSFLAADVRTVVASFLDLEDRQAQRVFPAFYSRLAKCEDPARALRQVCLDQPIKDRDRLALLCGSLAVYGISLPVAGNCS